MAHVLYAVLALLFLKDAAHYSTLPAVQAVEQKVSQDITGEYRKVLAMLKAGNKAEQVIATALQTIHKADLIKAVSLIAQMEPSCAPICAQIVTLLSK